MTNYPKISAMQGIGPAGECVYLTHAPPGCGMDLGPARSCVGPVFPVVAGGPDIDATNAAHAATFANHVRPPKPTPIGIINEANGLPADHGTDLGLVEFDWGTVLELDGYAEAMSPRPTRAGDLPPGMAVVTLDLQGGTGGYDPDAIRAPPLSGPPDPRSRLGWPAIHASSSIDRSRSDRLLTRDRRAVREAGPGLAIAFYHMRWNVFIPGNRLYPRPFGGAVRVRAMLRRRQG